MDPFIRLESGLITAEEAIKLYAACTDLTGLVRHAHCSEYRPLALYLVSELGKRADTIWRDVAGYVRDSDVGNAHLALDLIQEHAGEGDGQFILMAVMSSDLSNEVILSKVGFLLATVPLALIEETLGLALVTDATKDHVTGLQILLRGSDEKRLSFAAECKNDVILLYVYAAIFRFFPDSKLARLLPPTLGKYLEIRKRHRVSSP